MTEIPSHLTLRLETIFTKEENKKLKDTFSLIKRPTTFRINTRKWNATEVEAELQKTWISYQKLSFPKDSYILSDDFSESDLWKLICYSTWRIYIQGISSQIPPCIFSENLSQASSSREIKIPLRILDACAAPWGKTSQLSALYPNAQIYAFEPSKIRYDKMCHNLKKLGCSNVETIHDSIENIQNYISEAEYFDMILIDAPCSSEGALLYKNTKFLENWDISHIKKNYKRQKRICDSVLPYLCKDWEIVYSTCTLAPEENEWVIHYLLCNYQDLYLETIHIPCSQEITTREPLSNFERNSYKKEISQKAIRILPNKYSEWFFVAKLRKKEEI